MAEGTIKQPDSHRRLVAGTLIREGREEIEWSQERLGNEVRGTARNSHRSVSHTTISNWENGTTGPSTVDQIEDVLGALGLTDTVTGYAILGLLLEHHPECEPEWTAAARRALALAEQSEAALSEQLESPPEATDAASPSPPAPAPLPVRAEDQDTDQDTGVTRRGSRRLQGRRMLAAVALVAAAVVGGAVLPRLNAEDNAQSAATLVVPEVSTAPATAPIVPEVSTELATTVALTSPPTSSTTSLPALANLVAVTDIDITFFCRERHGQNVTAQPIPGSIQWQCNRPGEANPVEALIDLDEACVSQVGPGSAAESLNSSSAFAWRCVFEFSDPELDGDACSIDVGKSVPGLALPDGIGNQIIDTWPADRSAPCPSTFVRRLEGGYIQEAAPAIGANPTAAAFVAEDSPAVFLEPGPWATWERLIQGLPPSFGGIPIEPPTLRDDTYTVQLSTGSVLVSGSLDGDYYPLITFTYQQWIASGGRTGCLGLPTSDPAGDATGFQQTFERGSMFLDLANTGQLFLFDDDGVECDK